MSNGKHFINVVDKQILSVSERKGSKKKDARLSRMFPTIIIHIQVYMCMGVYKRTQVIKIGLYFFLYFTIARRCRQQVVNHKEMFSLSRAAFPFIIIIMTPKKYFYFFFLQSHLLLAIFKLWNSELYNNTGFLLNPNRNVTQVGVLLPPSTRPPNRNVSIVNQKMHIICMPARVLHAEPTPDSHTVVSIAC